MKIILINAPTATVYHGAPDTGVDAVQSGPSMLEETVELSHGGIMQSFLRFGLRFEADETFLELRNPLYRASRNDALTLQRPCFINDVASVFSEESFQFRELRFGVAGNISVQRPQ